MRQRAHQPLAVVSRVCRLVSDLRIAAGVWGGTVMDGIDQYIGGPGPGGGPNWARATRSPPDRSSGWSTGEPTESFGSVVRAAQVGGGQCAVDDGGGDRS